MLARRLARRHLFDGELGISVGSGRGHALCIWLPAD
jgi:hypothetical protein